jgi:hypothetical protein
MRDAFLFAQNPHKCVVLRINAFPKTSADSVRIGVIEPFEKRKDRMPMLNSVSRNLGIVAVLSLTSLGSIAKAGSPLNFLTPKSNNSGTQSSSAARAWEDLENQAKVTVFLPGQLKGVGEYLRNEKIRAENEANTAMNSPLPAEALNSMVGDMASYLVVSLPNKPQVVTASNQLILAFPDLMDRSQASSNPQLQIALDSLRNKIFQNENMKANFVFVATSEADSTKLNVAIAGGDTSAFRDPLQRTPDTTKPIVYDPASIFMIRGKISSDPDPVHHSVTIMMSTSFEQLQTRQLVDQKVFKRTYMWHPRNHKWELQP